MFPLQGQLVIIHHRVSRGDLEHKAAISSCSCALSPARVMGFTVSQHYASLMQQNPDIPCRSYTTFTILLQYGYTREKQLFRTDRVTAAVTQTGEQVTGKGKHLSFICKNVQKPSSNAVTCSSISKSNASKSTGDCAYIPIHSKYGLLQVNHTVFSLIINCTIVKCLAGTISVYAITIALICSCKWKSANI